MRRKEPPKWRQITKAGELCLARVTYEQSAAQLGYAGRSGAFKAVNTALRETLREPADELRSLAAERLDRSTLGIWRAVTGGDLHAIDTLLRIEARRAKLLGLDAPAQGVGPGEDSQVKIIVLPPGSVPADQ